MTRVFDETKPDRMVVYNALYSVNRVVCRLAETRGVPQYYLHAGDNLSRRLKTLVLARGHAFTYYQYLRGQWPRYRDRPCPSDAMRAGSLLASGPHVLASRTCLPAARRHARAGELHLQALHGHAERGHL